MIQNDGSTTDSVAVKGDGSSTGFAVKYYLGTSGSTDITTAVTTGSFTVVNLAPAATQVIRAVVTAARSTKVGTVKNSVVTSTSASDTSKLDVVKARVTVN